METQVMKSDVWYVLHEKFALLEERFDDDVEKYYYVLFYNDTDLLVGLDETAIYPSKDKAELAIERAKKYGLRGRMMPVCFPSSL